MFKSFFRNAQANKLEGLSSEEAGWKNLWNLLSTMVLYKCWNANRKAYDQQTGQVRETSFSPETQVEAATSCETDELSVYWQDAIAFIRSAVESWPELQRSIALQLLEGRTPREISDAEKCSQRTAERVRQKLRKNFVSVIEPLKEK